jgi:hypothetical protein
LSESILKSAFALKKELCDNAFFKATELTYANCEDATENGLKIRAFAEAAVKRLLFR